MDLPSCKSQFYDILDSGQNVKRCKQILMKYFGEMATGIKKMQITLLTCIIIHTPAMN